MTCMVTDRCEELVKGRVAGNGLVAWLDGDSQILHVGVGVKHAFHLPRPTVFPWLMPASGYGFPSGHATMAFSLYGYLAVRLVMRKPGSVWRWLMTAAALAIAFAIAGSRLYLGVHWPTDVLGGTMVATFWVAVCAAIRARIGGIIRHGGRTQ